MFEITTVLADNTTRSFKAVPGSSLLEIFNNNGLSLTAICGSRGTCGKCRIKLLSGTLPITPCDGDYFSKKEQQEGWRLACMAFPAEDISVELPGGGEDNIFAVDSFKQQKPGHLLFSELFTAQKTALSFARQLEPGRRLSFAELKEASKLVGPAPDEGFNIYRDKGTIIRAGGKDEQIYGVAIDIGTTTIGFALVDLRSGNIAGRHSTVNKQREYGGDVITRIQKANEGGLSVLSQSVRRQIAEGISALCTQASTETRNVCKIAIAANTTMLHLLLGLSCWRLGRTPFTPVSLDMVFLNSKDIFESDFDLNCEIVILPGISTYVGADITAGIYFTELYTHTTPVLFLDIGTNGEMALFCEGKILCTATAAGPAFEGGNILWGTGSIPGAISQIKFRDGVFDVTTIENKPPVGICGSGVVDMVSQGLKYGQIQPNGRLKTEFQENGIFLAKTPDGRDIVFCQKDVREMQLGKSAIRSGIDAMLNKAGFGYDKVQTVYIAGGFGFNLNIDSAAGIGIIPSPLLPKVSLVGNGALGGAVKYLLSADNDEALEKIIEQSEEFSLPEDKYFMEHFIENINFG